MKAALFLLAVAASAQGPVFRADTRVVEVAVIAKNGQDVPITDLRKGDLRLFDNGVEQTILSFDKLAGGTRPDASGAIPGGAPAAASAATHRLTVILLDGLNTSWSDQISARDAVSAVLSKLSPERDRIAIFTLGNRLRLLQDFSSDFASLRASVDRNMGEQPFFGVDNAESVNPYAAQFSSEQVLHGMAAPDPQAGFIREQRLLKTLDALTTIARILGRAQGEKNLLWMTAGFRPPLDHKGIQRATRELAAAKVMLYPVDARGLLLSPLAHLNVDSMMELAEQTGGRAYYNDNGLAALVQSALDDSREGYVLTYAPSHYNQDGSPHVVRLKTARKGVQLRYRPGYDADRAR